MWESCALMVTADIMALREQNLADVISGVLSPCGRGGKEVSSPLMPPTHVQEAGLGGGPT